MPRVAPLLLALTLFVSTAHAGSSVMAKYVKAVNGTTIAVDAQGKPMTVRLYGVATPDPDDAEAELQRLGKESTVFLAELLKNQWVYVEFAAGEPRADKDGIIDAYVYVHKGANATFINEKVVREGLAIVNRRVKTPYTEKLLAEEAGARASSRGMWGAFKDGGGKDIAGGSQMTTYIGEVQQPRSFLSRWMRGYY